MVNIYRTELKLAPKSDVTLVSKRKPRGTSGVEESKTKKNIIFVINISLITINLSLRLH